MRGRFAIIIGAILLALVSQRAHAVITAKTPLKAMAASSTYILVGKVDKYSAEKKEMLVTVTEDIKGKAPFRKLPINCNVADEKTFKENKIEPLLKRFGPDLEIIFFLAPRDKGYVTFAFTNGTWFQLEGTQVEKDQAVFRLNSAETYFRKTFKGTTEELQKLLKDFVAGKIKLPPVDDKVEPGFGPEYTPKKGAWLRPGMEALIGTSHQGGGPLFGVIPTIGLGAPLAILALLFPSIFGGVFVLFRQWLAFITVISLNSTLLLLQWGLGDQLPRGSWWATPSALWFLLTLCTAGCAIWAWRRQLDALSAGEPETPWRTELMVLLFMSVSCIVTTIVLWFMTEQIRWTDVGWTLTIVMTAGILVGTLYRAYTAFTPPGPFASLPLATEGVIIGAMLLGQAAFVPFLFAGSTNTTGTSSGTEQGGNLSAATEAVKTQWIYTAPENFLGFFASNPIVEGDAVYAGFSDAFQRGTMVRLDRHTGSQKWAFYGNDPKLRQIMSTPCLTGGRLYFGEGFHDDKNCHVFCIDAENGKEVWHFKTAGQTESSPVVVNGKVYIGAGNDGIYSLDAQNGTKIWHYERDPKARLLRFGGGMVVVGNRLYCATGVDRNETIDKGETAIFCFDAANGKEIWRTPAPYPVWSTPILKDGQLFVTSGNGDVNSDVKAPEIPGGAIQCLNADDGKEQWIKRYDNGNIEAPAVDAHRVYFGCRNRTFYCLRRSDGEQLWERFLESPLIASPVLDSDPVYERTLSVFVTTTGGKVVCLTPQKGDHVWTFKPQEPCLIATSPRLVVTRTPDGYRRQLYVGCGLGGGADSVYDNRPVLYCLEDKVRVE